MSRGHIVRQLGGRRRVLSAINAVTVRLYGPDVRLRPLAYVTGHKPRGSNGSLPERGAQRKAWTRASTGPSLMPGFPRPGTLLRPGPYSEGPGTHPRDPACLLGSPRLACTGVRCPSAGVRA
jgi:hypothetical protein